MAGDKKRRQKQMNKTKAQLVDELEALERDLAGVKDSGKEPPDDGNGLSLESETLFKAVIDNSPAAILLKDTKGRYLMANPKWNEWFNPKGKNVVGKTIYDLYPKAHADKVAKQEREVLRTKAPVSIEHLTPLADGTALETILHKFPVFGPDGEVVAIGGININVSEIKETEEALRLSEGRLNEAIHGLQQAFALYDADDCLVAFNDEYARIRPAAEEIMEKGGTFEDIIRANMELELIPEAIGREEEFIRERIKEHRNPKGPIIRCFRDGTWSRIEEVKTPTGGIALSFIDITDLKQTEEALVKNEALLRAVVSHSPTKIHIKDVEGRYTLINKEAEKLFGFTQEQGQGKTTHDFFSKKMADAFVAHDKKVIESGEAIENEEEFEMEDGPHTYLTVKFPIYDLNGVSGVGAIGTDITQRKKAEEAARHLSAAIDALSESVALYDADDRLIYCNPQWRKFNSVIGEKDYLGRKYEHFLKTALDKGLMPNAVGQEKAWLRKRLARHRNPQKPFEMQRQDGLVIMIHEQKLPDGGILTMATDITEKKQAEQALIDSEARLRDFAEIASDWFWEMDENLRFTYFSGRNFDVTGYKPKDLVGKSRLEMTSKENLKDGRWQRHLADLAAHRPFRDFNYDLTKPDGSTVPISISGAPIFDADGNFKGYRGTGTDYSAHRRFEKALLASEQRFKDIAESTSDWIWEMGPDLKFTYFSDRFAEITGFPIQQRIGTSRFEHVPREQLEAGAEGWADHMADLEARRPFRNFEYATTASSKGFRYVSVSGRPVFSPDGEFLGYRGTGTEITEKKRAEQALKKAKEQAELANRAKTEFLANMSHELRTPLNSILGFSEVIMTETFGPLGGDRYMEYAGDINSSGRHLLGLINEVLDLSKLEVGELKIYEDEIDIPEALKTCVKMVKGRSDVEKAVVKTKIAKGLPKMLGDEQRFKQILLNLLGNAVKFTAPDGRVDVDARICKSGRITIEVTDNGIGIDSNDITKVLEPFGQAREVMTRNHEGSGLGLYLAKSFTELHGGTLEIDSQIGIGTKVTLRFPKERTLHS
ncbi:MAG: PAS domain S-box protein [Rhodospirillales bacterium]|nr:PAS domain S-box protein [Rhodospirillales bacterium]